MNIIALNKAPNFKVQELPLLYKNDFIEALERFPSHKPVLVDEKRSYFAAEILEKSINLASSLKAKGFQVEDRVVIAAEAGAEFIISIYACMMLKAQVAIIDPEMGRANYEAKLWQFAPKWAIVDNRLLFLREHPILRWCYFKMGNSKPYFPPTHNVQIISTGPSLPILQKTLNFSQLTQKSNRFFWQQAENHPFLIVYTSGTLGIPKGVLHSLEGLKNSIQQISLLLGNDTQQKIATHLPHFMLLGINTQNTVHLWNNEWSAQRKLAFIKKHKITTIFGPPSDFLPLMNHCKLERQLLPHCLKHLILGSAPVQVPFLHKLINLSPAHTKLTCTYGMTENLLCCTVDGRKKAKQSVEGDLLGKTVEGVALKIAEDQEILVQSPQSYLRYWHEENKSTWHPTGDLGYVNEYGQLVLIGRKKNMIIRRHMNIYPGLYEPTINSIPGIQSAVLLGVYHPEKHDEEVVLVVEKEAEITQKRIHEQLEFGKHSIDKEARPDRIVFKKLPRKGRQQKIDRNQIKETLQKL
jgi:acyl-CoA synthetase (AMP-forming)/AMP-acid ligase II